MKYTLGQINRGDGVMKCCRCLSVLGGSDEIERSYNTAQGICDSCRDIIAAALVSFDKGLLNIKAPYDREEAERRLLMALYPHSGLAIKEGKRIAKANHEAYRIGNRECKYRGLDHTCQWVRNSTHMCSEEACPLTITIKQECDWDECPF